MAQPSLTFDLVTRGDLAHMGNRERELGRMVGAEGKGKGAGGHKNATDSLRTKNKQYDGYTSSRALKTAHGEAYNLPVQHPAMFMVVLPLFHNVLSLATVSP